MTLRYEIQGPGSAFDVAFYRSADAAIGGDVLLDTMTINDPADLTPGIHVKSLPIGAGASAVALPGAGSAETSQDYYLLAAAVPATIPPGTNAETTDQDGLALLTGAYHIAAGAVLVQGTSGADTVSIGASAILRIGSDSISYSPTDVAGLRIRLHGGDDRLDAAAGGKAVWASGGDGSDILIGGIAVDTLNGDRGSDQLTGGPGNDAVDGGDGGDRYLIAGVNDGADAYKDRGAAGVDQIVATAAGAQIKLPASFSASANGIEAIHGDSHAGVTVLGTAAANTYNFGTMTIQGVALIDAAGGNDNLTGTSGDDTIVVKAGNDTVNFGLGRDTAVFAGNRGTYSLSMVGGVVYATDRNTTAHGNDGADALRNVELLQFLDETIDLTANTEPVAADDNLSITEDAVVTTLAVLANDVDTDLGDALTVSSVTGHGLLGTISISANKQGIVYVANSEFQRLVAGQSVTETIVYTVSDKAGATSTATATLTVTGVTDGVKAMPEGVRADEGSRISIDVMSNDIDDDSPGDMRLDSIDTVGVPPSLELILIYGVGVGRFNPGFPSTKGSAVIAADGRSVLYTPHESVGAGESEIDFFRYQISDNEGRTSVGITTITVFGVNDAPVALEDADTVRWNDSPLTIDVLANDHDPDATDSARLVSVDGTGLLGSVALSSDGAHIVYDPGSAFADLPHNRTATEAFRYTIEDESGARATSIVTITVTGSNQAPVAGDDAGTVGEDGAAIAIAVLDNDTDPDLAYGDTMTIVETDGSGLQGSIALADDGRGIVYTQDGAFQGLMAGETATERFGYTIADGLGLRSTATATVTVHGANDAPTAVADAATLSENAAPATIAVLGNDADPDDGDSRTVVAVDGTGLIGSVQIKADGSAVVYTVAPAFESMRNGESVTETFSYTMADSAGVKSSATVTVTVVGANEAPVFVDPPAPPSGAIQGSGGDDILDVPDTSDWIYGHAGDDEIFGNGGADKIFGGAGKDEIEGGAGNDILNGGADRDDLTGDTGADIFRFYRVSDSTVAAFDRIRDFEASEHDKIDLSLIDANYYGLAGNNDFFLATRFTGAAGELVLSHVDEVWTVLGDVTGDGVADLKIEVRYDGILDADDFWL